MIYRTIFLSFFNKKKLKGSIAVKYKQKEYKYGRGENPVNIDVLKNSFFRRVIHNGDIGFGEAYFKGEFETNDLRKLLLWFISNKELMPSFKKKYYLFEWTKLFSKLSHKFRDNTRQGSKKNIKDHYDVSNDFYSLWLDDTMTYSSAVFGKGMSLKQAQENKYEVICKNIKLKKSDHVIEIGSGWGGFAIYAAKNYGCKVTTITISNAQFEYARKRIIKEKLDSLIDIQLKDYRDLKGQYDKIVSIEMMEALGHKYVPLFINKCSSLVKSKGLICYQCITYPDDDFHIYLNNNNYIKKHIFPGGELLSINQIKTECNKNKISIKTIDSIGLDYARTLNKWTENFLSQKTKIIKLGFSEENYRKWLYYFIYCSVGFETSYLDNVQITLEKT